MEKISKKKVYFRSKTQKNEYHYWVLYIWIIISTNFQLKLTTVTFWTKFANKGRYFQSKTDKIDTTIEFCIFELVFALDFTLNKQFCIFGPNLPKKDIYGQKQKNWTSSLFHLFKLVLGPNFSLNWQFWFFWPDLPNKVFSGLKQKKWTPHIFYVSLHIQISLMRNFSSNWQFWFFGPGIPSRKQKKWTSTWNFAFLY